MRQQSDPQNPKKIIQAMASDGEEEISAEENVSALKSENETSENEGKKLDAVVQ